MRLAILAVLIALAVAAASRPERSRLWGDEGTYVAMTASLVRDGDLAFGNDDHAWVLERQPESAVTVILQETRRGITYSKPILYPMLSAPLFAALGETGMVLTQVATLVLALILAWIYLSRLFIPRLALLTLSTLVVCSVVLVYVDWKMSDLMLFSLTLAGLVLALGGRQVESASTVLTLPFGSTAAAIGGGLLLGATASMRFTALAVVAAASLALIVDQRWRRGVVVGVMGIAAFMAVSGLTVVLLGVANPYKAVRSSFNQESGYPAGESTRQAEERFTARPATQSASWRPPFDGRRTAYSTLYFLVGRHTGLLLYFPAALVLLGCILRSPDRVAAALLLGLVATIAFYLLWMPQNYFGGSTFVGNRYFLSVLPILVVALRRPPRPRTLMVAWVLAGLAWGSAAWSIRSVRDLDHSSQSHAFAGLFRWLPAESTAWRIDGLEQRFWADDYLRFLDPYGQPARWSFRLDSDRPAAELLVATHWPGETLRFVVAPEKEPIEIAMRDWRSRVSLLVPQEPPAPPGLLHISVSPPWRRHDFWWKPGRLYNVRVLRLALDIEGDHRTTAVLRYAGRGRNLAPLAGKLLGLDPLQPIRVPVGGQSDLALQVRNTGRRPWTREGLFAYRLGYTLLPRDETRVIDRQEVELPATVKPGTTVEITIAPNWPTTPGDYDLVVEILRQPAARLGDLGRSVLATQPIQVEVPLSRDSREP